MPSAWPGSEDVYKRQNYSRARILLPFSTAFAEDRKMNASDVMVRDVVTIGPDDEISTAVRLLADHDVSALPVVDADGYVLSLIHI